MSVAELLEIGARPIRPDAPSGDPQRDSPEFETLQSEVRKLELPHKPALDWDAVIRASAILLGEKSKDLLVVSYLCLALFEKDGFAGLATGLTILRDLLGRFWDTLYPEPSRMRGRLNAITWLSERTSQRLERSPGGRGKEEIEKCAALVEEIETLFNSRAGSPDLSLGDMRRALERAAQEVPESGPEPARETRAPAPSPVVETGGGGPSTVTSADTMDEAMLEARRLLRAAGDYLRSNDPTNALGYRMSRLAMWLPLKQLPPNEGGRTGIRPPQPHDLLDTLEQGTAAEDWQTVLNLTEERFPTAILCLDLQRYAVAALEGMGDPYRPAAGAICLELAGLLQRFPALVELRYENDQPFADADTLAWIEQRVLGGRQSDAVPRAGPAVEHYEPAIAAIPEDEDIELQLGEILKQAQVMAAKHRLPEALGLLRTGAARAKSRRARAAWELESARLCMKQGHASVALAQLESLDRELRQSTIDEWDPALAVEVLKALLSCRTEVLSSAALSNEESKTTRELMSRLCRLDMVAALEMKSNR